MPELRVDGLAFALSFGTRRTLGVAVERDGSLTVRAPRGTPLDRIESLVRVKLPWVHEKLAEKALLRSATVPRRWTEGEGHPYLGRSHRLLLSDEGEGLRLHRGRFLLPRAEQARAEEHFQRWYAERGRAWLPERAALLAPRLGAAVPSLTVRGLRSRWGSCGKGRLNFDWRVMRLPGPIIDYIVIHELAHLAIPHHGPAFWSAVERALPDWAERKSWLRENGARFA